jgi:hypothetical protein
MSVDLTGIRFGVADGRVVRAISQHPRLTALLPAELEELTVAFRAAQALADEVSALKVEAVDFAAVLDKDLRAGRKPNAAKLVEEYGAAQRRAAEIRTVGEQLAAVPVKFHAEIVRTITDAAPTFYLDLADQLDDVLDRGTEQLADLGNVSSPDEALDADKGKEWRALKALAAEYAEIRDAQMALIRSEDTTNFPPGSFPVALAMFAGITAAIPNVEDLIVNGTEGNLIGFKRAPLAWPVTAYTDPLHFLAVLRQRSILQPHVVSAADASALRAELHEAPQDGVQREPGRLAQEYGGEEAAVRDSYIAQRVRTQGPDSGGFVLEGSPPRSRR